MSKNREKNKESNHFFDVKKHVSTLIFTIISIALLLVLFNWKYLIHVADLAIKSSFEIATGENTVTAEFLKEMDEFSVQKFINPVFVKKKSNELPPVDPAGGREVDTNKTLTQDRVEYYVSQAIKNEKNRTVVLGCSGTYEDVGADNGFTYFELKGQIWTELQEEAGYQDEEIWKVNKYFIDLQVGESKEFVLSNDPNQSYYRVDGTKKFFQRELDYLKELGYEFDDKVDELWKVTKKDDK